MSYLWLWQPSWHPTGWLLDRLDSVPYVFFLDSSTPDFGVWTSVRCSDWRLRVAGFARRAGAGRGRGDWNPDSPECGEAARARKALLEKVGASASCGRVALQELATARTLAELAQVRCKSRFGAHGRRGASLGVVKCKMYKVKCTVLS